MDGESDCTVLSKDETILAEVQGSGLENMLVKASPYLGRSFPRRPLWGVRPTPFSPSLQLNVRIT